MAKANRVRMIDWMIRVVEFILVSVIVLDCNSVYRHWLGWIGDPKFYALWLGNAAAYLLILLFLIRDKSNLTCIKDLGVPLFISFVFVFEFNAFNALRNVNTGYLGYFLFFMTAMLILYRFYAEKKEPLRLLFVLEYIVLFIAVASLVLWFGACVLDLWGMNPDVKVWWGGKYYDSNYLNLFIRRWQEDFGADKTKNLGMFVEPPMYGLFLGYGLYTELFLKKKSNPAIVVIFLAALLSCRATLAIMLALLALFFLFAEMIKDKRYAKVVIPLLVALTAIGVMGLFFYKKKTGWGSFATHIDDFVAAIKCWLQNPILGCGYDSETPIQQFMSEFRSHNLGLSNSAAVVLAEGGIVLFTYYFLPFFYFMLAFFKKNRKLAYWGAGMFLFWVVVIFHTRLFIFFLLAFGYSLADVKVRIKDVKEGEKRISFGIHYPDDNLSADGGFFSKKILDLPEGFLFVMNLVLTGAAIYGLIRNSLFSTASLITSAAVLLAQAALLVAFVMKKKVAKMQRSLILTGLWILCLTCGQLYEVLDSIYTVLHLHVQDCGWSFLLAVTILYAIGTVVQETKAHA